MPESIVILGGGIVGLSTAYFLSLPPNHLSSASASASSSSLSPPPPPPPTIHLVDPSPTLFRSTASGLAGGFLARDWFAPPVAPLGAFSFDLHRRLAEACNGKHTWGWSQTEGWSLDRDKDNQDDPNTQDQGFGDAEAQPARVMNRQQREDMDLHWLMNGSSRATLLATQQAAGTAAPAPENLEEPGSHPKWVRAPSTAFQAITDRASTAQVDPTRLCDFLLSECLARGVTLHSPARATQLMQDNSNEPTTIRIEYLHTSTDSPPASHGESDSSKTLDIPCSSLILTSGAWTPKVYMTLFPHAPRVPRVKPLAGYSILVKSPLWTPMRPSNAEDDKDRVCHAIFTSDRAAGFAPEIFARAGGEIWFGGLNAKHLPLPSVPTPLSLPSSDTTSNGERRLRSPIETSRVHEDEKAIETLKGIARALCKVPSSRSRPLFPSSTSSSHVPTSSTSKGIEFTRTSLCFRPVSPTGRPYIGRVSPSDLFSGPEGTSAPNVKVFMGTAHGPWGISLSLGTGWVLGEMVRGVDTSVDVAALAKWEAQA